MELFLESCLREMDTRTKCGRGGLKMKKQIRKTVSGFDPVFVLHCVRHFGEFWASRDCWTTENDARRYRAWLGLVENVLLTERKWVQHSISLLPAGSPFPQHTPLEL